MSEYERVGIHQHFSHTLTLSYPHTLTPLHPHTLPTVQPSSETDRSEPHAPSIETVQQDLLRLAHHLSREQGLALWGEGNVSAHLTDGRFLVKASGTQMASLRAEHLVEVEAALLLQAMAGDAVLDDEAMRRLLLDSRVDPDALKPSVESLFHAWLLELPGIRFVGHCHPTAVNQVLCSPQAEAFARQRLFPDHIVYCGPASVLVPYVDPGLVLARAIARRVLAFTEAHRRLPKTILLENHGLIAIGTTVEETMAAIDMMEKAARVFVGAASLGGPTFMPDEHVQRIAGRPDEHYRQRMLARD